VFDLSDGTVDKIGYSFIEPRDIVKRSISQGFQSLDPMMKPPGIVPVPSAKDVKLRLSGPVSAARFARDLNLVRQVTNSPAHQVRCPLSKLFICYLCINLLFCNYLSTILGVLFVSFLHLECLSMLAILPSSTKPRNVLSL